jgi:hypothetical protein
LRPVWLPDSRPKMSPSIPMGTAIQLSQPTKGKKATKARMIPTSPITIEIRLNMSVKKDWGRKMAGYVPAKELHDTNAQ